MSKSEFLGRIAELESKYFDLVWIARHDPSYQVNGVHPGADAAKRIRTMYPDEIERLSGESSDWEHGFNSGCLAAFRLAMGLLGTKAESQMAESEFPFLDT